MTANHIFQSLLLLIAAGSAVATYWFPPVIIGVGITALIAYSTERYVSFREQDLDQIVDERVKQREKSLRAEFEERFNQVEENARYASNAAERIAAREGLSG